MNWLKRDKTEDLRRQLRDNFAAQERQKAELRILEHNRGEIEAELNREVIATSRRALQA